jgi:broad specificity phosphatase PhoE
MKELILVRHGQYDSETGALTALGRRQALAVAAALRGQKLTAMVTGLVVAPAGAWAGTKGRARP